MAPIRINKGVKPLAELVTGLINPACRKRGMASASLTLAGVDLFGERLSASCEVERIVWPRGSRIDSSESTGATLVIRASGASALTLQHMAPQIVERANLLIGWPAIARVRVTQVYQTPRRKGAAPARRAPLSPEAIAAQEAQFDDLAHQDLKHALARLAAAVASRGSTGDQKDP